MESLEAIGRQNYWNQPVYAQFWPEIDPFDNASYFRDLGTAYDGNVAFWQKPSPEPHLNDAFWQLVKAELENELIQKAAAQLAASISVWENDPEKLLFIAILRAGVPVADWLCRLLPGATAVSMSLFAGLGVDKVAYQKAISNHPGRKIIFVDGWTGRGGVARELEQWGLGPLAVLIDPWGWAAFSGTEKDIFCPTACFTGVTTLGFSRTFYVDNANLFAAYLFPEKYGCSDLVTTWQSACPSQETTPIAPSGRFFTQTGLRLHSNEVCRALINADPETIFFADDPVYVKEHYPLLLILAEQRSVPVIYHSAALEGCRARVGCRLRKSR